MIRRTRRHLFEMHRILIADDNDANRELLEAYLGERRLRDRNVVGRSEDTLDEGRVVSIPIWFCST